MTCFLACSLSPSLFDEDWLSGTDDDDVVILTNSLQSCLLCVRDDRKQQGELSRIGVGRINKRTKQEKGENSIKKKKGLSEC